MIRVRAGHATSRPARLFILAIASATIVAACVGGGSAAPGTRPATSPTSSAVATGSDGPTETPAGSSSPGESPAVTPTDEAPTTPPGSPTAGCSGSDANREFFRQAAAAMSWTVYCAVLPDGWFIDAGSYRLANGGHLEVTYRGPADVHVALVEGNVCAGSDVDTCAPRDAVIGPADFGDRQAELGRLANGLVLDIDRGATPSWRATGLGLTEEAFRAICAAFLAVEG